MQDLRLVGVHEDGRRVVLGGPDGQRFTLPIDDALRAAARHDRPRLGQLQIEMEGGARPREVQALVRSGLTAEEVSARTGWSIERVRKYEGPVIDERYHIAIMGRTATLPHTQTPTPLEERVVHRLATREVDPGTAAWDAWRGESGRWTLAVTFSAGGRERRARWTFDIPSRTVRPLDDEARWLSEDDPASSVLTGGLDVRPPSTVYDVEAEGGITPRVRRSHDPVDLVSAMRERSRTRRGPRRVPAPSDLPGAALIPPDALPLDDLGYDPATDGPPPAAHPRLVSAAPVDADEPDLVEPDPLDDPFLGAGPADLDAAPLYLAEPDDLAEPDELTDVEMGRGLGEADAVEAEPGGVIDAPSVVVDSPDGGPGSDAAVEEAPPARRTRRPSVPSWDEIVFGTGRSRPGDGS